MKRIYIAGPFSANNVMDVLHNIRRGIETAYEVFRLGYSPFCPWLDYHFVLMDEAEWLNVDDFYRYSIDWLEVSDAILITGDYENSKGTLDEIQRAKQLQIPIFYDINEL